MVCLLDECWPYLAVPLHLIMKIDIEDPREVLICVKGVPICYVHIDGSITYLSQIVSILNTYILKINKNSSPFIHSFVFYFSF